MIQPVSMATRPCSAPTGAVSTGTARRAARAGTIWQERLHRCQCRRDMAQHSTAAQALLQTTDLVDIQETGELLYQGRYWQESLQAETLHPGSET